MALHRLTPKRLYKFSLSKPSTLNHFHRDACKTPAPPASPTGHFRRFFQRRDINLGASLLTLPVGEKLRDTLRSINIEGYRLPPQAPELSEVGGITVSDVKKIMKVAQLEKVKARFRDVNRKTVSYNQFTTICVDACCGNEAQGLEFAKLLDEAGNVLVFGNIVFLQPEQVVKSVEHLISESISMPNEQREEELEQLETQKIEIDRKSHMLVRQELYGGLAFLMIQTIGFMRLTFWELSWDVMEPICFFVTSLHFALAYGFFLHTSTEPSFQGYYQCRFRAKQSKLIKAQNFDIGKYNRLMKTLRPNQPDHISTYEYSPSYA